MAAKTTSIEAFSYLSSLLDKPEDFASFLASMEFYFKICTR